MATSREKKAYYKRYAKKLLKDARVDNNLGYWEIPPLLLEEAGENLSTRALTNKVNRGTFSFTFALQFLSAIGVKRIDIPPPPKDLSPASRRKKP